MSDQQDLEKARLLSELANYVHVGSGRKIRADIGQSHTMTNKPRSYSKTYDRVNQKMATYNRLRAQLNNRDYKLRAESNEGTTLLSVEFDCNGFYLPIPEMYTTKGTYYKQVYKGREIIHTQTRVRTQKYIDLEKYRFEAWQYQALTYPDEIVEPSPDLRGFLLARYGFNTEQSNRAIINRQITWSALFEEIYYIPVKDISLYSYELWREYYSCCPDEVLPEEFRFVYGVKPGSSDFHPEWEYISKKALDSSKKDEEDQKARKSAQYITNLHRHRT